VYIQIRIQGDTDMRTIIDSKTGVMILFPDSELDRQLIGHLINCSDLSEFTTYLDVNKIDSREITKDLGVAVDRIDQYTEQHDDRQPVKQSSIKTGQTVNLIGFNRDSTISSQRDQRGKV